VTPDDAPAGVEGFNHDLVGSEDYVIPATQHDAVLWLSGSAFDLVFDVARQAIATLDRLAVVAEDTSGWLYRYDRDLTGFIDGTENPTLIDAPGIQRRLVSMLESMAGLTDGDRDALTYYTRPLTGANYLVPSNEAILRAAGDA
jgi:hypothetical protein